jgi:hypothetical protein
MSAFGLTKKGLFAVCTSGPGSAHPLWATLICALSLFRSLESRCRGPPLCPQKPATPRSAAMLARRGGHCCLVFCFVCVSISRSLRCTLPLDKKP